MSFQNTSVPKLKIVILVAGSRGDVQPYVAVAKRLQEYGHYVRLATHSVFRGFVKSAGVNFYPLGGDPKSLVGFLVKNKYLIPSSLGEISATCKEMKDIIDSLHSACTEPDPLTGEPFKAGAIIANPAVYGHTHLAEALGVPLHIFFTIPWTPTHEFSHPFLRVPHSSGYWLSYIITEHLFWLAIRGYINDLRKNKLKLAPIPYFDARHASILHLPTVYIWSTHVLPKPSDWGPLVDIVGYCFLDLGSEYKPSEELSQWIKSGDEPVYFGFGSMPLEDPKRITDIILEALKNTGQRGIIDRGWGELGAQSNIPESVYVLADIPHDWLFPQCSAVIHHGGAGTTAAGLKAGRPTTVIPFFGDQYLWGEKVYQKGVGPSPIPISQLSVESLSEAIRFMLQPEVKTRALEISSCIRKEDGVEAAVEAFHRRITSQLPLTRKFIETFESSNPVQWIFVQIGKLCCLPCGS